MASIRVSAALAAPSALPHPGADGDPALKRRVSFNLGGNSVLQLPSNTAVAKITQARAQRGAAADPPSRQAERRAQALLPHGASLELLDSGCAMTALCVRRGHICAMNAARVADDSDAEGDALLAALPPVPPKGVLKPFAPSPINAEFLANGLPDPDDTRTRVPAGHDATVPGSDSAAADDNDSDQAVPGSQPPRSSAPARREKQQHRSKKSRFKTKRRQLGPMQARGAALAPHGPPAKKM